MNYDKYSICDQCGKSPIGEKQGEWTVFNNHCECGGYIRTDFKRWAEDEYEAKQLRKGRKK